jgi:hypothetical protein
LNCKERSILTGRSKIQKLANRQILFLQALINNKNDAIAPIDPYSISCLVTNKQLYPKHQALAAKIRIRHNSGDSTRHRISPITTPSPICKLCNNGQETQGHILGSCKQELIQSLILKGHGTATTKLVEVIKTSRTLGNCAIFLDAEGGEHTARSTDTLLWYPSAPTVTDDAGNSTFTSLPDAIIFPKISSHNAENPLFTPTAAQKDIILLDATYTDDLKVKDRYQHKLDHHNPYILHLQTLGWRPKLYPIVLTHSGCVTLSLRTFLETDCGLTPTAVNTLTKSLQKHTFSYNSKLNSTRYHLKKELAYNHLVPTGVG